MAGQERRNIKLLIKPDKNNRRFKVTQLTFRNLLLTYWEYQQNNRNRKTILCFHTLIELWGQRNLTRRMNFDGISNVLSDEFAASKNYHKFL